MPFEDLGTWEIWAERDGTRVFQESFEQAYPEDAVRVVLSRVEERLSVQQSDWPAWTFRCIAHTGDGRIILFGLNEAGRAVRLVEQNAVASRLLGSRDGRS